MAAKANVLIFTFALENIAFFILRGDYLLILLSGRRNYYIIKVSMDKKSAEKWRWMAPLGLTLIGMGFSLAGEATIWKQNQLPWIQWVSLGTAGLVVLNSGISVFGDAVKRRFWHEWHSNRPE
jgi:hypothetical protein